MTEDVFGKICRIIKDNGGRIQESFFYPNGDGVEGYNASIYLYNETVSNELRQKLYAVPNIKVVIRETGTAFTSTNSFKSINILVKDAKQ